MEIVLNNVPGHEAHRLWESLVLHPYPAAERVIAFMDHFSQRSELSGVVAAGQIESVAYPESVMIVGCHHNLRDGAVRYLESELMPILRTSSEVIETEGISTFLRDQAQGLCNRESAEPDSVLEIRSKVLNLLREVFSDVRSWQFLQYNHEIDSAGQIVHFQKPIEIITALDQCAAILSLMVLNPGLTTYFSGGRNRQEGEVAESDTHFLLMQLLLYDPQVVAVLHEQRQSPATINARLRLERGGFNTPSNIALCMMLAKQERGHYPHHGGILTLNIKMERMREYLHYLGLGKFCCIGIPGSYGENSRRGELIAGRGNGANVWGDAKKLQGRVGAFSKNGEVIEACRRIGPQEALLLDRLLHGESPISELPWVASELVM